VLLIIIIYITLQIMYSAFAYTLHSQSCIDDQTSMTNREIAENVSEMQNTSVVNLIRNHVGHFPPPPNTTFKSLYMNDQYNKV